MVVIIAAIQRTTGGDLSSQPYLLFFPVIILVSFGFDRGTGFYTTLLLTALSWSRSLPGVRSTLELTLFMLVGLFCAAVIEALRLTVDELGERKEQLERDIENRKRTEAALVESEARFRATFELAASGMALVGLNGRWLRVNPRLCMKLGYTEEELLSKTFQDITHPEDLDADLANVQQLLRGDIPIYNMEKRYFRKDGSLIWILLTVALVRDEADVPQYFISVIQDISAKKEAERVLTRDREELERLVKERTAALIRAAEDHRRAEDALRQGEKLQALGQLTGGIAHDFNNFLQVVGAGTELLMGSKTSEQRRREILDGMKKATKSAADLTGRLLAFARRQALRPERFDLNARLLDMTGMLRHTLKHDIKLVDDLAPDLWLVQADPHQFEVSLVNLVMNARDAMPNGGTLTLVTRNGVSGPRANVGSGFIELIVRDTGEGMSEAVLARVFEPFFTTKGQNKGTGLGLAQVHGFMKQSGGDVFVESSPGQGTTITLRLPRAPVDEVPPGTPESAVEQMIARSEGRTVLVVDDNPEVRTFAAAMLAELGYSTQLACDATQALEILDRGSKIDAVFSDIVMPGAMNGLKLAARVHEQHPGVAVVLATGYSAALSEWRGARIWETLNKPYRLDELGAALERALAGKPG